MIHPHTKLVEIRDVSGVGIVATKLIPKGTITWCRDDLDIALSARELRKLPGAMHASFLKHAYLSESGMFILNWDDGRYQNHSCDPTSCLLPGLDCEIALRDIAVGEQITSDYATYNLDHGFDCFCGSPACRSQVLPADKTVRLKALSHDVIAALACFESVPQPLAILGESFPQPEAFARFSRQGNSMAATAQHSFIERFLWKPK